MFLVSCVKYSSEDDNNICIFHVHCTDVVEGESIDVQCTAKDGVPSAAVYWQYPGEKLKVQTCFNN